MAMSKIKVGAAKYCISPTVDMMPIRQDFSGSVFEAVREGEGESNGIVVNGMKEMFKEALAKQ